MDDIVGVGDAVTKKEAENLAALSGYFELVKRGLVRSSESMTLTMRRDSLILGREESKAD